MHGSLKKALAAIAIGVAALAADTAVAVPVRPDVMLQAPAGASPASPETCYFTWDDFLSPASTTTGPGGTIVEDGTYSAGPGDWTDCLPFSPAEDTSLRGTYHAVFDPTHSAILEGTAQLKGYMAGYPVTNLQMVFATGAATFEGTGTRPGLLNDGPYPTAFAGAASLQHYLPGYNGRILLVGTVTITPTAQNAT